MTTHVTLHGPGELLAAIERLLGFEPRESVVVAAIHERGELGLLMRVDRMDCLIPDVAAPMARAITSHLARDGALHAVMVTYTDNDVRLSCPAVDLLRPWVQPGVQLLDHWAVVNGRYFSPGCADDECCPPEGLPMPPAPDALSDTPTVQSVGHDKGRRPTATDAQERRRAGRAASRWWSTRAADVQKWRKRSGEAWAAALETAIDGGPLPTAAQAGTLIGALRDARVRDAVVMMMAPHGDAAAQALLSGGGDAEVAQVFDAMVGPHARPASDVPWTERVAQLCEHLATLAPAPRRAPVCTVNAMVWWQCGQTQRAHDCLERALACDGQYRLAELLWAAIRYRLGPAADNDAQEDREARGS